MDRIHLRIELLDRLARQLAVPARTVQKQLVKTFGKNDYPHIFAQCDTLLVTIRREITQCQEDTHAKAASADPLIAVQTPAHGSSGAHGASSSSAEAHAVELGKSEEDVEQRPAEQLGRPLQACFDELLRDRMDCIEPVVSQLLKSELDGPSEPISSETKRRRGIAAHPRKKSAGLLVSQIPADELPSIARGFKQPKAHHGNASNTLEHCDNGCCDDPVTSKHSSDGQVLALQAFDEAKVSARLNLARPALRALVTAASSHDEACISDEGSDARSQSSDTFQRHFGEAMAVMQTVMDAEQPYTTHAPGIWEHPGYAHAPATQLNPEAEPYVPRSVDTRIRVDESDHAHAEHTVQSMLKTLVGQNEVLQQALASRCEALSGAIGKLEDRILDQEAHLVEIRAQASYQCSRACASIEHSHLTSEFTHSWDHPGFDTEGKAPSRACDKDELVKEVIVISGREAATQTIHPTQCSIAVQAETALRDCNAPVCVRSTGVQTTAGFTQTRDTGSRSWVDLHDSEVLECASIECDGTFVHEAACDKAGNASTGDAETHPATHVHGTAEYDKSDAKRSGSTATLTKADSTLAMGVACKVGASPNVGAEVDSSIEQLSLRFTNHWRTLLVHCIVPLQEAARDPPPFTVVHGKLPNQDIQHTALRCQAIRNLVETIRRHEDADYVIRTIVYKTVALLLIDEKSFRRRLERRSLHKLRLRSCMLTSWDPA
eukprot:TRINITY_DN73819_c0_g1_i1.p1 TRINITY_DN73819_c0_g1~~TRINITY_DN73819_c0_g1_i1.p1  ORF type:complete len:719 (+),score=100.64 TRINITY_DN73819_c0_g1_i1:72-2228(+)